MAKIRFACQECGHKITVDEAHAGKKGKCPKCKTVVTVPAVPQMQLAKNPQKIVSPNTESEAVAELSLKRENTSPTPSTNFTYPASPVEVDNAYQVGQNSTLDDEKGKERRFPWFLDIFLYPASEAGLINLGIYAVLPIVIMLINLFVFISFVRVGIGLVAFGYMLYYFFDCIRESAAGYVRAPDNIGGMPDISDAFGTALQIIAMVVVCWGPIIFYSLYLLISRATNHLLIDDKWFWPLLGYGIFFFPIGILALAMFDSSSAFNPFLWIISILKTFVPYCGLVLLLCGLVWLFTQVIAVLGESFFRLMAYNFLFVYFTMIGCHLLGRFYYRFSDKLNWGI